MRLPRVRLTVRWLMVAVAAVGILFPSAIRLARHRRDRFVSLSNQYLDRFSALYLAPIPPDADLHLRHINYFMMLYEKYDRAARYPWLPVAPDPPEPE